MAVPAITEPSSRADEIRRAAIGVFAAQGFRRTSMADLAHAAGVSRPALYQYFEHRAAEGVTTRKRSGREQHGPGNRGSAATLESGERGSSTEGARSGNAANLSGGNPAEDS